MRRSSEFIADTAATSIIGRNLHRELSVVEAFFAELQQVFAEGQLHNLGGGAGFAAIDLNHRPLRNRVNRYGYGSGRTSRPQLRGQVFRYQGHRRRRARGANCGLQLDGLSHRYTTQGNHSLTDPNLVLVEQEQRKIDIGNGLPPEVLSCGVQHVGAFISEGSDFPKLAEGEPQNRCTGLRPDNDLRRWILSKSSSRHQEN